MSKKKAQPKETKLLAVLGVAAIAVLIVYFIGT